jgi:hypothetical protein
LPATPARFLATLLAAMILAAGCNHGRSDGQTPSPLLPKSIRLHPFTAAMDFDAKGASGVEANVELRNYFDDATMALGTFQFSLYRYRPHQAEPRGDQLDRWTVDLTNPKTNQKYWDPISRTYKIPLALRKPIKVGKKFVLEVTFAGPGGPRLFDRLIRTSGEGE